METLFSTQDRNRMEEGIREKYIKVAVSPEGLFKYPTGSDGLEALGYDGELIQKLPEAVAASFCGVGNPFHLASVKNGGSVLDIGCGAGVDTILAGIMVGPSGSAIGIDVVPEMLDRARDNLRKTGYKNVTFHHASAEDIPFPDETFDMAISNGVFNLVPDKARALKEAFRVLKPEGYLITADQILVVPPEKDRKSMVEAWSQ